MLIAAVQLNSGPELEKNLQNVLSWLRLAAEEGAELVAFPENCLYLGNDSDEVRPRLELDGPELKTLQLAATQYNVELLLRVYPGKNPSRKSDLQHLRFDLSSFSRKTYPSTASNLPQTSSV
jgi:predicted amidohydrolase